MVFQKVYENKETQMKSGSNWHVLWKLVNGQKTSVV